MEGAVNREHFQRVSSRSKIQSIQELACLCLRLSTRALIRAVATSLPLPHFLRTLQVGRDMEKHDGQVGNAMSKKPSEAGVVDEVAKVMSGIVRGPDVDLRIGQVTPPAPPHILTSESGVQRRRTVTPGRCALLVGEYLAVGVLLLGVSVTMGETFHREVGAFVGHAYVEGRGRACDRAPRA